ncbi:hypothetical protein CkaCkLH20_00848 [Colletotrichum karsti]|uniref:Uncharacterized protein n=1 Tax=Colletotrichum karsti TaxID=1095194 RepID=A0A9P6LR23_9PEZI|nr:uncharacterized protein CkaCkLH20_00848 [Colletotrichum karsti]KAF9881702.1 hypothetical protein CkaCkLH20_00848 [Colletotrichum karsti]
MDQYVQAAVFTPRANSHDGSTTSSEETTLQGRLSSRKGSIASISNHQTSTMRSLPRRGRKTPVGNISLNTKVKPAYSVFTSPGSFEQLYNEKAYLHASLRVQGGRSFELMRRLTILHEKMDIGLPSDERRKARKKAALIKSKITEAAAQEKAISIRLCDINAELSMRERWMQVQHEIYDRRYPWWAVDSSPLGGYIATPSDFTPIAPTPLDAASPVFFPVGYYPVYSSVQVLSPCHEPEALESAAPGLWVDNEMRETAIDALGNHGLRFCYDGREKLDCAVTEECGELAGVGSQKRRGRRMSLPSLRCLWPGQQEPALCS